MRQNKEATFDVHSITKMAICVALLCVSAYISFPLPFASAMVTALTVAMNLAAFILTPQQTLVVMLMYTAIGAAGLPVFVDERVQQIPVLPDEVFHRPGGQQADEHRGDRPFPELPPPFAQPHARAFRFAVSFNPPPAA